MFSAGKIIEYIFAKILKKMKITKDIFAKVIYYG